MESNQEQQEMTDLDLMIDPFNDEDLMTDTLGPSYTDASHVDSAPEIMGYDNITYQQTCLQEKNNQSLAMSNILEPELFMINHSSIIDRINADSANLKKQADEMYFDPTQGDENESHPFERNFVASSALFESDDTLSEKMRSTTKNLASLSNISDNEETKLPGGPPMLDLQQFNAYPKAAQMNKSESLFGKVENDSDFQSKDQTDRKSENSSTSLNKSRTSGSSGESIFSTSKQETTYTEDFQQISSIFDKTLFDQINAVDHIRDVERHLEEMKTQISDKKRLQKERNVLTAQLSRDRKKLENELLREKAIQLTRILNVVRNKIFDAKCKSCGAAKQLDFIFDDCKQYLDTNRQNTLSDTASEQSEQPQLKHQQQNSKIDFEKYAKKPNLVNRITKKNKEVTRVTTDRSQKSKSKRKMKVSEKSEVNENQSGLLIGKRTIRGESDNTLPFEYQEAPDSMTVQNQDTASENTSQEFTSSAFQMIPLFGGRQTGTSKFAKIGMAAASILAVSTCLLGVFGDQGTNIPPEMIMEDPIYINEIMPAKSSRRNLQELNINTTMPPQKVKLDQNWSLDFEKVLQQINPEEQEKSLTLAPTPCNNIFKAREFLEQTSRLENMREDFLYRELVKMCKESGQENQYAEQLWKRKLKENDIISSDGTIVSEFEENQNSPVVYKAKENTAEPKQPFLFMKENIAKSMKVKSAGFCEADNQQNQLEQLNDMTTTLSCANPSLILPHDKNGNAKMLNMTKTGDNQYLHIVLPANELNILNQRGEISDNKTSADQNTYVEIGCKIFEINHLQTDAI